jgi:hypothetical protein
VLIFCWVGAGVVNGDYSPRGSRAYDDLPWQLMTLPMLPAVRPKQGHMSGGARGNCTAAQFPDAHAQTHKPRPPSRLNQQIMSGCLTWALAATASVAAYSVLVAENALDYAPIVRRDAGMLVGMWVGSCEGQLSLTHACAFPCRWRT